MRPSIPIPNSFFARDTLMVARELLGTMLEHKGKRGVIMETEAYASDEASHAFRLTPRSRLMHETYGHVYIYMSYGMHWCLNITSDKRGAGAVLIRAIETPTGLVSGPGRLTKYLGISRKQNGTQVGEQIKLYKGPKMPDSKVVTTPRIGISRAKDLPWRFVVKNI